MATGGRKDAELDKFLRNVDEVDSIIKGLASDESSATEKADEFLQRYQENTQTSNAVVDRSVINDEAFKHWDSSAPGAAQQQTMDAESFMAAMEADCRERAERRKIAESVAEKLKLEGNELFQAGDYVKSVELYTEALSRVRHWTTLYTNRAQAHLRLQNFEAALEDCRWAFKVDEKCLKAAIIEGKAYVGLKQYDKAVECYSKAKTIDPRKDSIVNGYIERARIKRTAEQDEQTASQTFEASSGAGLVSVLEKLRKPGQLMLYYIGGLEVVRQKLCSDGVMRTLFRSSGGFELADSHHEIVRCLNTEPGSLSASDVQLTALYLHVLHDACIDNDENQCHMLAMKQLPQQLMRLIECVADMPQCHDVASAGVNLLLYLSQSARNRADIVLRYDTVRLITAAFVVARRLRDDSVAVNLQRLICNLAMSDRLRRQLRDDFEQSVLSSFDSLLQSDDALTAGEGGTLSVKTMVNLCGDEWIRRRLSDSRTTWSASVSALDRLVTDRRQSTTTELLSTLLSLLSNMAINGTSTASQHDLVQLSGTCVDLLTEFSAGSDNAGELVDRCYLVLSRILRASPPQIEVVQQKQFINAAARDLHHLIHHSHDATDAADNVLLSHCLAALTACTMHSEVARQALTDVKPSVMRLLVKLLVSQQQQSTYDDLLIGNAALCLSHCVEQHPSAMRQLISAAASGSTDLVMVLLLLARDQAKPTVQHNCAILIAKLVQQHQPYLDRLRELHGLEILHTVLRHVEH